jgi:hypothetical protein
LVSDEVPFKRFNHDLIGKNGFGAMGLRERFGEDWWWNLNMKVHGEDGVLVSLLGHMGWGYGRIFGGVVRSSQFYQI